MNGNTDLLNCMLKSEITSYFGFIINMNLLFKKLTINRENISFYVFLESNLFTLYEREFYDNYEEASLSEDFWAFVPIASKYYSSKSGDTVLKSFDLDGAKAIYNSIGVTNYINFEFQYGTSATYMRGNLTVDLNLYALRI